jgi:spermidine/putrescine transport system ATP-binding protein
MRGALSLLGLRKSYAGTTVLDLASLEVQPGEFLTLLGPSGCGKTTLLRLIAGFEQPDAGRVLISGMDATARPPYERPVNTVFQHYALFPHRDVRGNVAFGLEMARRPAPEIEARVHRALELVQLPGFEARRIDSLSGGQRQRVALARALVLEPEVLLLDEPLAALDLKLRKQMQVELKQLHERLQLTFVFVTHDQDEALVMSDRIAVMNDGRIEQLAAPEELYERPRTRFVAEFLAVRNILDAEVLAVEAGLARLRAEGGLLLAAADDGGYRVGASVVLGVRPERLRLDGGGVNRLEGVIEDEIYLGDRTDWRIRAGALLLTVAEAVGPGPERRRGDAVTVSCPPEAVLRLS